MTGPVELGAGTGVVAVIGGVLGFVADGDAAEPLVTALREAASGDGTPGRRVALRLASLVAADDAALPDFGVLAPLDDGWVVLLRGAVAASVVGADGAEERFTGEMSTTWVDRIVPPTTVAVLIAPAGTAPPGASPLRLEAGVVPGGWLRIALAPTARPTSPQPILPPFEAFSLDPEGVEPRPPLPVEGVTVRTGGDVAEADEERPIPGASPDDRQRVSLGLLVFDDGAAFGLDEDYVLGREPEIDESVVAGTARPIALDDPADTVSRVHAEIRLAAPDVHLIDRGSTNGTHLWDVTTGSWDRLTPGQPRVLRPGERGAVGRRTFVFESSTTGTGSVTVAPVRPLDDLAGGPGHDTVAVAPRVGTLTGPGGAVYPLDRCYVVGRDPLTDDAVREALASPIVLRDDQVSRVHAYVTVADGTVSVRDAGTVAGTFVAAPGAGEWEPVGPEPVELPAGGSLRVGPHVFTYRPDP